MRRIFGKQGEKFLDYYFCDFSGDVLVGEPMEILVLRVLSHVTQIAVATLQIFCFLITLGGKAVLKDDVNSHDGSEAIVLSNMGHEARKLEELVVNCHLKPHISLPCHGVRHDIVTNCRKCSL